ncbi:MAG: P22 phage major capsid protein family protein [Bradyrhizobium sp.]
MATNSLLTPSLITKETLVILENNLVAAGKVNRQFENQFVKIGTTLTVRKPNKFTVTTGPGLQVQNITEPATSITISNQKHVDFLFSSADLTLVIEEFSERYLKPAAAKLANQVDFDVLTNFNQVFNEVGTPGTPPNAFSFLAAVGQRMDEGAVPQDGRVLIMNPAANWSMAVALSTLYVRSVAEPALKGFLAAIANFEIYMDQNIQVQTVGAYVGAGHTASGGQTGASISTNNWTGTVAGLLNLGDVITFAGVHAVNPENLQSTGQLQQFVVTATVNSTSGAATIPIYPAITTSGAYQTVDSAPINAAPITVVGTASTSYAQNLGFVRDAFGLVTVPMELPDGVDFKAREMYKNVSMRIVRQYDINNDVTPCRIDVLYGTATYYPELACRLTN